jgi:peptidoglycan/LPS O-acetylase OafA/YrhL
MMIIGVDQLGYASRCGCRLALTLLIATLSWRYFELPLVRVGHKFNYHP